MGQASSVATHPMVDKIVAALVAEQPYRNIIAWAVPPVTTASLSRFKRKAMRDLGGTVAKQAKQQAERSGTATIYDTKTRVPVSASDQAAAMRGVASPFRARLESLWSRTDRSLDRAETAVRVTMDKDSGEYLASGADVACIAPLLSQAHKNLELLGRATGELQDRVDSTTQIVVVNQIHQAPSIQDDEHLTIDIGQK